MQPRHESLGFSSLLCPDPSSMGVSPFLKDQSKAFSFLSHLKRAALGDINKMQNK